MSTDRSGTWLVFQLAEESYVVPVTRVDEVLEYTTPTCIPRSPVYLRGILNVRGRLIPVLDLRRRFGLAVADITHDSRIVVINLDWEGDTVPLGVLVDAVSGVVDLPPEALSDPPTLGRNGDGDGGVLTGTARWNEEILLVLDPDSILTAEMVHRDFRNYSSRG